MSAGGESQGPARPRVVILGAGFGGLYAARALKRAPAKVTVVDRRNYHLFQPLLYQVATAGLNPSEIAAPIRRVLRRQANTEVVLGEAVAVDLAARRVDLLDGRLSYDFLIVATGASHSYFGRDEWAPLAPGLKTLDDALEIRRRIFVAFEMAERHPSPGTARPWLTFVVVGAGPTGVELAGTIAEIARGSMSKDFRHIRPSDARVILLEGLPRVLPPYPPDLSEKARRQLQALGVEVRTSARVTAIDRGGVSVGGERISARSVFWAAGVEASPLARTLGVPLDSAGRVLVREDLTVPEHPEVFVIGDLASLRQGVESVPGVAPAAIQEGRFAARQILRRLRGEAPERFRYWDRGSLATIGRDAAVADLRFVHLSGLIAWLAWLLVHIFFLIGFRNRLLVLFDWATAYLTYERGARLITGPLAPREPGRALDAAEPEPRPSAPQGAGGPPPA